MRYHHCEQHGYLASKHAETGSAFADTPPVIDQHACGRMRNS